MARLPACQWQLLMAIACSLTTAQTIADCLNHARPLGRCLPQNARQPMQLMINNSDVVARTKELARSWDLDLLLRTYTFIPRKILRNAVREFGTQLEGD